MDGISYITVERARQVSEKGYTSEHDDVHAHQSLAAQAVYLATPVKAYSITQLAKGVVRWEEIRANGWHGKRLARPMPSRSFLLDADEPIRGDDMGGQDSLTAGELRARRVKELAKAGALIAAEIDRLLRVDA